MNKLSLSLDELRVDTFHTTPTDPGPNGTVFGQQCTCDTGCTCPGCPSCDESCAETCRCTEFTCGDTCDQYTCDGASCFSCVNAGCTKYEPCYGG